MARKRASSGNGRRKKVEPELVWEDGYYWIVSGTKRLNVGRNQRVAERMLLEQKK